MTSTLSSKIYYTEIPAPLRKFTGEGEAVIPMEDVRESIAALRQKCFVYSVDSQIALGNKTINHRPRTIFDDIIDEIFGPELCQIMRPQTMVLMEDTASGSNTQGVSELSSPQVISNGDTNARSLPVGEHSQPEGERA